MIIRLIKNHATFLLLMLLTGLNSFCWAFVFPDEPGAGAIAAVLSSVWLARIMAKNDKS